MTVASRGAEALRRLWRRSRRIPGFRSITSVVDAQRWARAVLASAAVDPEYVAAQLGRDRMSAASAARAYAFGGFRRGISIRPDVDEAYAAGRVPDGGRVPAYYSHLLNVSVPVRDPEASPIDRDVALRAARQWAGGTAAIGALDDDAATTVVLLVQAADPQLGHRLRTAAQIGDRVKILAIGVGAGEWVQIADAADRDPRIGARLLPASADPATAVQAALPPSGRFVVVDSRTDPDPDAVRALLAAAGPGRIAVPLEIAAEGTIEALGAGSVDGRSVPLLSGLPIEDVARLGDAPLRVPAQAGLSAAGDAASLPTDEVWAQPGIRFRNDLPSLRTHSPSAPRAVDHRREIEGIYRRTGFEVASWADSVPRLRRPDGAMRWAVKVASLAGPVGDLWGDTHFGEALAEALRRRGHEVVVDRREAANRATSDLDDVHLVVRGPTRIHPPRRGVRILWIISHPHEITTEELAEFDLVFAASESWSEAASRRFGRQILPLLECTDATRYRPHGIPRSDDIIFVGKSRDVPRRVVMAPIEAGIRVKVYGPDWGAFIPADSVVAPWVPTSALPEMYEAASVVLNDQWAEMREAGFPAMRPFDVVAAGGRVISEDVDGLQRALGPGVVTYRHEADLVALLREDGLDRLFPSDAVLRENAERVRREHSFDARAGVLNDAVTRLGRDMRTRGACADGRGEAAVTRSG